jgi:hypothetical protein
MSPVLPGVSPVLPGAQRLVVRAPSVVVGAPSYSECRQECSPRVWYSPEMEASKFTLHIHSDTPGGSQRLNYILLMGSVCVCSYTDNLWSADGDSWYRHRNLITNVARLITSRKLSYVISFRDTTVLPMHVVSPTWCSVQLVTNKAIKVG